MDEYISRKAAIAYIREQSEECQKAFEEFGGESGIYADAYNDLAEEFYSIPAADVSPVVYGRWEYYHKQNKAVCTSCSFERNLDENFGAAISCPNCGAKMDGCDDHV